MKAVIVSSGEGTRLRPITCSIPVCMLPVMGRPIAEHTVRLLGRHKISDVTICEGYLTEEIKKHFSSLTIRDMKISIEPKKNLDEFFRDDDTLIISDSILTDIDITELSENFSGTPLFVTKKIEGAGEFGFISSDGNCCVTGYKRCVDFAHPSGSSFMGVMIVPKGTSVPDCKDILSLVERLCERGDARSFSPSCYIKNILDFESYHKCCRDFMDKKVSLPFPCDEKAPSVWIEEGATVMQGSVIVPPVYIGRDSFISKGARIEAYSQIGRDVSVDAFSGIKRSIVMDNSVVGEGSSLRGAIIGKNVNIGFESAAYEGSVIGFGSKIGRHSIIKSTVHIWPEKHIEDECTVSENIIWEKTAIQTMFGDGSVTGIINRDITPEFAATLGRSAVSVLGKKIAVSDSGFTGGSMIKNALISGIQAGGGTAYDMGEEPLPITRSAVRFYSLDGGIALSGHCKEGAFYISLDIMNSLGADIENEELLKLSHLAESGEAKRENASQIKETEYLFEYKLYYLKSLINSTSGQLLGAKILINCDNIWARELLEGAAKDLLCEFVFTKKSHDEFVTELRSGNFDFGVICDYKCEKLSIVKNSGDTISEFDYCALVSLIIMKSFQGAHIFVSQSAPRSIEILAEKYGADVTRTKVSPPYLMNELSKSSQKPYLWQFIYQFDAVGAIILLLDFLHMNGTTIEALQNEIPRTFTISSEVCCARDSQEKVIRALCENHNVEKEESLDAIKITFDNGWGFVVPKKAQSVINVIGHSFTMETAQEIADMFTDEISKS